MAASVDDVEHRYRKAQGLGASEIAKEGDFEGFCRRMGHGHGNTQNCIGSQAAFVFASVRPDQLPVDLRLLIDVFADDAVCQDRVDVFHRVLHTFSSVPFSSVSKLHRLILAGAGSRGHGRLAHGAILRQDFHLHRGISPGIQDFSCVYIQDL